jgi:hypothetical protein
LLIGLSVRLPLIPLGFSDTLPGALEKYFPVIAGKSEFQAHYFSGSSLFIEVYELNVARAITRSGDKSDR